MALTADVKLIAGMPGGLTVEVVNMDKVLEALINLGPQVVSAAQFAADKEAVYELQLTQKFVPVATGDLKGTGRTEDVENEFGEVTAAIAYGDELVDYALAVHEDLDKHHEPPTKAKYVEDVVYEQMSNGEAAGRMVDDMRELAKWM